jgi:hypothetical protein
MVHRTDTRQRMLDTAAELFRTQGYHSTGLNQLVAAGGAPRGCELLLVVCRNVSFHVVLVVSNGDRTQVPVSIMCSIHLRVWGRLGR